MKNNKDKYLGKTYTTNEGYVAEIIEYNNNLDIVVKFIETGNTVKTRLEHIISGKVKNINHKSVYGVGFIGVGNYITSVNGKMSKCYSVWARMIKRCYYEKEIYPTYEYVFVIDDWHNFQNFAEWFKNNYTEGFELDKDIISKGNKVYSPETCCFVPHDINTLLVKSDKIRGEYPIGVYYNSKNNCFISQLKIGNKEKKHLGSFNNVNDAFMAYKTEKEKHIKVITEKYKYTLNNKVYTALINYKVEITD